MSRRPLRFLPGATCLSSAVAVGLVWVSLVPAAEASASRERVRCGDTITRDTKLKNDLVNCPNSGIVIGADNITLDLNGHTIDGDGLAEDAAGVDNVAGYDGVTIERGSVREFVEGVLLEGASDNRVRGVTTSHQAHGGITVVESDGVQIERNTSAENISGIIVFASRDVQVERNSVSDIDFAGVPIFQSEHVRVAANSVSRTGETGILVFDGSDRNRVERNLVKEAADGITVAEGSDHNRVSENSVSRSGDGVILDAGTNHNIVTKNVLRNNFFGGVAVVGSDDNLVSQNSIIGSGDGTDTSDGGIHVLPLPDEPETASDRNLILNNTLVGNDRDGIRVEAGQSANVIKDNRSTANTDDGIDIESFATTLTGNTTNHNHDLGIEAVPGVTDGGGNKASGNGNPLQCVNVFCL